MAANTLNIIRKLIGFPEAHWGALCTPLLATIPTHELDIIRKVLTVRQSFYLPPGAAAEDIYRDRDLWTYATLIIAIRKLGYECPIPEVAQAWLSDPACKQSMELALANPPTGVLHDIVSHIIKDNSEYEKSCTPQKQRENVQTEHLKEEAPESEDTNHQRTAGEIFLAWLKGELNQGNIIISKRGSLVHAVEDGLIITSPKAFKQFNSESWEDVRDSFLDMGDTLVSTELKKWQTGSGGTFITLTGYLVNYEHMQDITCDININYDLEECA